MNNDLKVRSTSAETTLRPMHAGDLVAMHGLAQQMSWPHRPEDCAQLLALGAGTVAVDETGHTVGVGLRWSFGEVGTIGLVLVAPDRQGRGTELSSNGDGPAGGVSKQSARLGAG
jgi:hypothetical protein